MIGVNLIPTSLLDARRHRRLVTGWIVCGTVYAGLLIVACTIARSLYVSDCHTLDQETGDTIRRTSVADQDARIRKAQLADLQDKSQTARAIAGQPDWSILLIAIANRMGDELVLRELHISPGSDSGAARDVNANPLTGARKYSLTIRGLGRSSAGVAKFVSSLEETKFFDEVKLTHTGREPFLTGTAVSFDLECSFGASAAPGRRK